MSQGLLLLRGNVPDSPGRMRSPVSNLRPLLLPGPLGLHLPGLCTGQCTGPLQLSPSLIAAQTASAFDLHSSLLVHPELNFY